MATEAPSPAAAPPLEGGSSVRQPPAATWGEAFYSFLLLLYPTPFREEYGEEMAAAFAERWAEVRRSGGAVAPLGLALAVLFDTLRTAFAEHGALLAADLRQAWRNLSARRHLPFTLAAGTTLALGIGGAIAIFALVHAVLLAPLPFHEPDRVVHVENTHPGRNLPHYAVSIPDFLSYRERSRSFTELAAIVEIGANLSGDGRPERLKGMAAGGDLFGALGLPLLAGRSFSREEAGGRLAATAGQKIAILGEGLWRRRFGADPAILGRALTIDGVPRTVIGVAPQDAGFATDVDLWLPLEIAPDAGRGDRRLDLIGRLAPGATPSSAQAEMATLAAGLASEFPEVNEGWSVRVEPVERWIVGPELRERLIVLVGAVALLLLVACANVANLQMARAAVRLREVAVRLALGASPGRVVRHLMTENLLLAGIGGAAGLGLAWLATRSARSFLPPTLPRLPALAIDPSVAGFAFVLVVGTGLAFGLAPSLFAAQGGAIAAGLRRGGRSGATGSRSPVREGLVVTQLALATLLAIGAALLGQSFLRLQRVPLGFDSEKVLTARLTLPEIGSDEELTKAQALCSALLAEVRTLPGVTLAGLTSEVPMGLINTGMDVGAIPGTGAGAAGSGTSGGEPVQAAWRIVTSDYLRALQVPLRQGRFFAANGEGADSTLLSEGLARRLFPGADPIGRRIWLGNGQARSVVGVVGDVHQIGVTQEATPTMYFSTSWYLWSTMILTLRTEGDPAALAGPLRDAVRRVAPEVPLFDVAPLQSVVAANVAPPRLQALVVSLFAVLSLTLAAVGVAGVVAYSVAQRTPELAVRAALGAEPRTVVGHVLRRGLALSAAGVGLGVLLAALLGGGLEGLLYGVEAREPATYALVALVLLGVGGLACWLPARRAAAIPPIRALQGE